MKVDFEKLKKLREETDVSYALCKKALEKAHNDIEKARNILKRLTGEKMAKKTDKETTAGGLFSYTHHNRHVASLVEIRSETDFVSSNEEFQKLGQELAMQVASTAPGSTKELLKQEYIRDPKKKVADLVNETAAKFGENIQVQRAVRWQLGE